MRSYSELTIEANNDVDRIFYESIKYSYQGVRIYTATEMDARKTGGHKISIKEVQAFPISSS